MLRCAALAAIALFVAVPTAAAEVPQPLQTADVHLQKGRYEEALEILQDLGQGAIEPTVAVTHAEALQALGRRKEAEQMLTRAVESVPDDAALWARLAEVRFERGRYELAETAAETSLQLDENQLRARLVRADVYTETGRIDKADNEYRWFISYYNRAQPRNAESLLLVARGALQYARWHSASQIFSFVVNTVCPDALREDARSWEAHYLSGSLLLEKYNRSQALPEFRKALAINPRAAPVHVALGCAALQEHELEEAEQHAQAALETDPGSVSALLLKADARIRSGDVSGARRLLEAALAVNPREQRTLGRLAACYLLQDGAPPNEQLGALLASLDAIDDVTEPGSGRFVELLTELARRNPRPGYFLTEAGNALESRRQYEPAKQFYKAAMTAMPQLSEPKTALALLYMSVGMTDEARVLLDEGFRADPYHVRISNMRKVLKLLDGYETITTDHFVIRVDSQADVLLGRYMAEYLEETYNELVEKFDYEPPNRTTFEIYHSGKGQSAHQWFSARMIGLPWIQTIGASTGVIVALASPTAAEEPFNWARVLKHELVHVITMQQTRFNIPHWFTEALAVTAEGFPRPALWNELLLERVPRGELRDLNTLNDGFMRPKSAQDWQFAYCQSRLYAQYMIESYGEETIPNLLEAYRDNMPTKQAIEHVLGVDRATFEAGYRDYLRKLVAELKRGAVKPERRSLAELERVHLADPGDAAAAAAFAYGLFRVGKLRRAGELAEAALQKQPTEPLAALVIAHLELRAHNPQAAVRYLRDALRRDDPHPGVLALLARLEMADGQFDEAAKLYEMGRRRFPYELEMHHGLAAAYERLSETAKRKKVLERLALLSPDDAEVRKARAEIALDEENYEHARQYARSALFIDVLDPQVHRILGKAHLGLRDYSQAAEEFDVVLQLSPNDVDAQLWLARTHLVSGNEADARSILEAVLEHQPEHAGAKDLLEELD